ncbi:MAG: acyl-ACP desaturase [Nitriliruptoraceae bacterium]
MAAHRRTDRELLAELEPVADAQLRVHEKVAEEWFPHDYIPYSVGRDFDRDPWTPDQSRLTGVAQIAFEVNLMTEDNLPSYHREIHAMFGEGDGAWINWIHRWTAEEGRHSIVLRDYLVVTRAIDPYELERARMAQVMQGYDRNNDSTLHGMAYVSFQELATRISHRNTGRYSDDPVADRIMARIAKDENLHMRFYRDMMGAAMQLDPSAAVEAIVDEVINFEMPGAGMKNFLTKSAQIASAGIYDLRIHHDEIVWPLLRHWKVFEAENLDESAERRRDELAAFLDKLDAQASRFEDKRAARAARQAARTPA